MKIFRYLSIIILAFTAFACDEVLSPLFDASKYSFVSFPGANYSMSENSSDTLSIPVVLAAAEGSDVDVVFEAAVTSTASAVEGVNYKVLNTGGKVTVKGGMGIGYIQVVPIDNELYTKDKFFTITLTSNTGGYYIAEDEKVVTVKITDDEHPLAIVIGKYGEVDYLYSSGAPDKATPYAVEITPIDGSETSVSIYNFWDKGETIKADVDVSTKTISIPAGEIIYVHSSYGNCLAVAIIDGAYDSNAALSGTFDDYGNITFNPWSPRVSAGGFGNYRGSILTK